MKRAIQVLAGLNAVFQIAVGALSVAAPAAAATAFKVTLASPAMGALIRMFGGLLAASGVVSGYIARDPERDRTLARLFALGLLINVAADGAVIASGAMQFAQLASGMVLEALLAVALLVHRAPLGQVSGGAAVRLPA